MDDTAIVLTVVSDPTEQARLSALLQAEGARAIACPRESDALDLLNSEPAQVVMLELSPSTPDLSARSNRSGRAYRSSSLPTRRRRPKPKRRSKRGLRTSSRGPFEPSRSATFSAKR